MTAGSSAAPALPQTPHALAALVDDEVRRQDAHLAVIRALAKDSKELQLARSETAEKPRPGLLAGLGRRLRGRRAERQQDRASTEDRLRARIEAALAECRKASLLADRFGALREALFADLERLHAVIAAAGSAADEEAAAARAALVAAGSAAEGRDADVARAQQIKHEGRRDLALRLQERLSVVVAGARGLLDVIDTLAGDVSGFARAAERELDVLSARARALSVAEDAAAVVDELERSLLSLSGSLDDVTVFASAVHERVEKTTSAQGLHDALEVLVQGALARRAAVAAKEQASAQG